MKSPSGNGFKAVRDRIPEIIRNSGRECAVKELSDPEFLEALRVQKILEKGGFEENQLLLNPPAVKSSPPEFPAASGEFFSSRRFSFFAYPSSKLVTP